MKADYAAFLDRKAQLTDQHGFEPIWIPDFLFDFQKALVTWAIRKGRAAIFADCGLGKTPLELVWAENVVRKTNRPVLIMTPLAVSHQTLREAEKFGIQCERSGDGKFHGKIVVTNYERLHHFRPDDFAGVVCDESSIIKHFAGKTKAAITEFMRTIQYRLLGTATAAPNDFIELGTSSEALGHLGFRDMITQFFKVQNADRGGLGWGQVKYFLRGHAEQPFWRWVCTWAIACRRPSDLGFSDDRFILPPLTEAEQIVANSKPRPGMLLSIPAKNFREEREERRVSLQERCDTAAALADGHAGPSVIWCHLNPEGDLLEKVVKDGKQVCGSQSDEEKEERLLAFQRGQIKTLIVKPKIGCFGLNWQHCNNVVCFPTHSFEQYYQAVRRCWRFGQTQPVTVTVVATEGEHRILANLRRKAEQADRMFSALVQHMAGAARINDGWVFGQKEEKPRWLQAGSIGSSRAGGAARVAGVNGKPHPARVAD